MKIIQLKSKKELFFPPFYKGIVTMTVNLIQDLPLEDKYILRIEDKCTTQVDEEYQVPVYPEGFDVSDTSPENQAKITYETKTRKVTKVLGTPVTRFSEQPYSKIKQLTKMLQQANPNIKNMDLDDAIHESFRQGLYFTTKSEIEQEDLKWYGCDSIDDWEITRE